MTSTDTTNRFASYDRTERFAQLMDKRDPLAAMRDEFLLPVDAEGNSMIYMSGNSLGLQPSHVRSYIDQELMDWANLGVEGHFAAQNPWLPYHENLTDSTARLVGALPGEVVVMNSLTVNLHLMLISFYRPNRNRYKILIEGGAFPSDQYAVASQVKLHGLDPADAVVEVVPRDGEDNIRTEDILAFLEAEGESVALVLLGNCNYLTGQAFDMAAVTAAAHKHGCYAGYNLAHGAGNLEIYLHNWNVDFAVWCSYKYLNAGPGAIAGCFVHERHGDSYDWPRLWGWWGHDKATRFLMGPCYNPISGAEGWQLSNPPIFQLAALRASMALFDRAGMPALRKKSELLTGYLEYLLESLPDDLCRVITPKEASERGCQLSVRVRGNKRDLVNRLKERGAICDFREPDIMRVAPAPLYNSFVDVWRFCEALADVLQPGSSYASAAQPDIAVTAAALNAVLAGSSTPTSVESGPSNELASVGLKESAASTSTYSGSEHASPPEPAQAPPVAPLSAAASDPQVERAVPVVARPAVTSSPKPPSVSQEPPVVPAPPVREVPGSSQPAEGPITPPVPTVPAVPAVARAWRAPDNRPSERAGAERSDTTADTTTTGAQSTGEKPTPVIRAPQRVTRVTRATADIARLQEEQQLEPEDPLADTSARSSDTDYGASGGS